MKERYPKTNMRTLLSLILCFTLAAPMINCSSDSELNKTLQKANTEHLEALHTKKSLDSLLRSNAARKLPDYKQDSFNRILQEWEKSLVEVPGFEHSHTEENHNHNHEHSAMTNAEILHYQQVSNAAIKAMLDDVQNEIK